jgi:hypothetical protein
MKPARRRRRVPALAFAQMRAPRVPVRRAPAPDELQASVGATTRSACSSSTGPRRAAGPQTTVAAPMAVRHSRRRVPETARIGGHPRQPRPPDGRPKGSRISCKPPIYSMAELVDRTQEVGGSSPPSSIGSKPCSRGGFVVSLAADWHEPRPRAQPFAGRGVTSPREALASAFTAPRRPRRWSARSHRGLRALALLGGREPTGTARVARVPPRGSARRRRRFRAGRSWRRSACGGAR